MSYKFSVWMYWSSQLIFISVLLSWSSMCHGSVPGVLERTPVSQMQLSGWISKGGTRWGLIQANDQVHAVTVGSYIGNQYGKVTQVDEQGIVIEEMVYQNQQWQAKSQHLPYHLAVMKDRHIVEQGSVRDQSESVFSLHSGAIPARQLFTAVHAILGQAVVINANVKGNISLALDSVSLSDFHQAINQQSSIIVKNHGDFIAIMAMSDQAVYQTLFTQTGIPNAKGDTVSIFMQTITIHKLLELMAEFTGKQLLLEQPVSGEIAVYCRNKPWNELVRQVAATSGLTIQVTETSILVSAMTHAI